MMLDPLLTRGALELARLLRRGEISAAELAELHIARIQQVNPLLNAVVVERFDEARAEARAADRGHSGAPLCGVPCTVKDCFGLPGLPQTGGSVYHRRRLAREDAPAIARTRAAGAIPLGLTNVPEMAMWMETDNLVYGRTRNPYDPGRTSGGSSGGEAAIISAGGSPFGIGTDIGGSIRIPSFFCGLFGHKPTGGLVPLRGHFPMPHGPARRYCTAGPMSRRATDLMPLLRIVAGRDAEDPYTVDQALPDPEKVSWQDRRVLLCESLGGLAARPSPELRQALHDVAGALADRGARVERWSDPRLSRAFQLWSAMMSAAGGPTFHELISPPGRRVSLLGELARLLLGRPRHTFEALALAALEKPAALVGRARDALVAEGRRFRAELAAELGDGAVLLLAPHPRTAPRHREPLLHPVDWVYTALFNVLELPATTAPTGLDRRGLPLGVQVVGGSGADAVTISAAIAVEEAFGGWRAPQLDPSRATPYAKSRK